MDNTTLTDDLIAEIEAAAKACGDLDLDTAEAIIAAEKDEHIECPICNGDGYAVAENDYCNFDNHAIGVLFYGIGDHHGAGEEYFRKASPANILSIIAELRALRAENAHLASWKAGHMEVMSPVIDYARSLKVAPLGGSVTHALIEDHKALLADAERYRWLADGCVTDWLGEEGPVLVHAKPWNANWRAELDAAIDAAMQASK